MMNTTQRIAATITAAAVAVTAYLGWTVTTGVKGFYSNQYSTISASSSARQAHATWISKQGANLDAIYGADSRMTGSGQPALSDLILRERRAGVRSIAVPYSRSGVTTSLQTYNRTVADSVRIDALISEIEPYNTGDYAGFYTTIRTVGGWCKANRVMPCVYMGWPSDAAWDSIVVNSDRVFLHCYRPSSSMSGSSQYGYVKNRLASIAAKAKARNKRMSIVIIYSCEPEFAYSHFATTSWSNTYANYSTAYNASATSDMRNWLTQDGWMVFVSQYAKQIRP